jgi:hypothetical protein
MDIRRAVRMAVPLAVEALILIAAYLAYEAVRRFLTPDAGEAITRALGLIHLEQRLGIFFEPDLQQSVIGQTWLITMANWIYVWGYLPVISGAAVYLYVAHRSSYMRYRNAFLLSGMIGLVIFATLPVAPPRMFPQFGFIDTVRDGSNVYRAFEGSDLVNQFAAVPSFHFGWILLVGVALFQTSRRFAVRAAAVAMPLVMLSAILLTANHYLIDALAGGATVLAALAVVLLAERALGRGHQASRGVFTSR